MGPQQRSCRCPAWAVSWPQPNQGQKSSQLWCCCSTRLVNLCFADTKSIACTIYPQRLDVRRHSAAGPAAFRANGTARSPAAIFNYSQALGLTSHLTFSLSKTAALGPVPTVKVDKSLIRAAEPFLPPAVLLSPPRRHSQALRRLSSFAVFARPQTPQAGIQC